jgi:hypothetical protein
MNEHEPFDIFPLRGAGKICLGMIPQQIEAIYGAAESVSLNHLKQRVEFRSFTNLGYSTGSVEGVSHIGFGRQMQNIRFKGANIFLDDESVILAKLVAEDGNPFIYLGFIVFLNLGMTLTGFHDHNVLQKAMTMFPRGAWDKWRPKLKPFELV